MNEKINKNNLMLKIQNYFKKNFKLIISIIVFVIILFFLAQIYFYNQSKKVLDSSILFNQIFSDKTNNKNIDIIQKLSKEKNFYGILATLENIKLKLINNELDSAYTDYLYLLNKSKISDLFRTIIAIQGSYLLIDKIDFIELNKSYLLFGSSDIYKKINNLLSFVDDSIESFQGHKLEIKYLILIIEQEYTKDKLLDDKTKELYQKIQDSDKITPSIKERVRKIHEFHKYK